jgi:hypothetical protein
MSMFPETDQPSTCQGHARGRAALRERFCSLSHFTSVGVVAAFLICILCYRLLKKIFLLFIVHKCWESEAPFLLCIYPDSGLLFSKLFILLSDNVIFNSVHIKPLWSKKKKRNIHTTFHGGLLIYIPNNSVFCIFEDSHSKWDEMKS